MRTSIAFFALISTIIPALAADLDQRRTLLVEHEWVTRVVVEPLTPQGKSGAKSGADGVVHFAGGVDAGPVLIRRHVKKNGAKVRYRVKPKKGVGSKVRGTFRTSASAEGAGEELQALNLRVRGKAPRTKVKGTVGAAFLVHDAALVVPAIATPFLHVIHDEAHPELTALARLRLAPDGHIVAVGHIGAQAERERVSILQATRWTVRPGPVVDEEYLGPDAGVALDLGPRAELVVGRMEFSGATSSDALWIENGNGFHVTDFGDEASGPVYEATHVAGGVDDELISVLRIVTGGVGAVRWSSVGGQTVLERPRETVGHSVRAMNDAGTVLGGDAYREGRSIISVPTLWDTDGKATVLPLGRDAVGRVHALSPDGSLAAGLFLDVFTDREPVDRHVIWDVTDPEALPITVRNAFGVRGDGAAANAGPTAVTRSGTVAGWDTEGGFLWRADWRAAVPLRAYLEAAGLSLPEGVDRLEDAVDVVGGIVLAGTTRSGSGDRLQNRHWVAFVPDTIALPQPR